MTLAVHLLNQYHILTIPEESLHQGLQYQPICRFESILVDRYQKKNKVKKSLSIVNNRSFLMLVIIIWLWNNLSILCYISILITNTKYILNHTNNIYSLFVAILLTRTLQIVLQCSFR